MPRKKKIEDEDIETTVKVVEIDPQDLKVKRLLRSMPGGLKCLQVFRYHPGNKGGRPEYLDDISPEQFDFKMMKSMFGGGKFQVKWDNEDGSESKGDFDIAGPHIDFSRTVEADPTPEPVTPIQPMYQPQPVAVQPQGIDPMMMLKMIQDARREAREEMRTMLEFMRPQQQSPDVTKQVFDIVEKIAPMMGGGDGGGNSWMMALSQFKDPILKIVDSVHSALTRPAAPTMPVHAQVQTPHVQPVTPNVPPPTQPAESDMMKILIRQYLPVLVNAARSSGDVGIYADMVLEQVPQTMYPKLAEWLNGSWFDDIRSIDQHVEYQFGWWNALRANILEGMAPDAATDVQSTTSPELSQD